MIRKDFETLQHLHVVPMPLLLLFMQNTSCDPEGEKAM
jgi:hypothetical protein